MAAWLEVNGEAIYGTRPWKIYGEGSDIRFTTKGEMLYVHAFSWPADGKLLVQSLKEEAPIGSVHLLGYDSELLFERTPDGLAVTLPPARPNPICPVLRIQFN